MEIMVKTMTGKTFTLNVRHNSTIDNVKHLIQDKESIGVEHQLLIFEGKELKDPKSQSKASPNTNTNPNKNIPGQHDSC